MKINVIGRIQLYEPSELFHCHRKAEPDGVGALAIQFEQLKEKADRRAFQDRWNKLYHNSQERSGVITSQSGAVIRDIITTVSRRRFPWCGYRALPDQGSGRRCCK